MTHLDGNVGVAAAQDGIDELAVVAHFYLVGDVAGFLDGHVELLVGGLELAAAHFDPAFRAVNLHAGRAAVEGLFREDDAVVVLEGEMVVVAVSRGDDLHGAAAVLAQGPLRHVEHMGAPVGHETAAAHFIPAPGTPELFVLLGRDDGIQVWVIVHALRKRAQPLVPVQAGRNGHLGQVAGHGGSRDGVDVVAAHIHLELVDLAQFAFAG